MVGVLSDRCIENVDCAVIDELLPRGFQWRGQAGAIRCHLSPLALSVKV